MLTMGITYVCMCLYRCGCEREHYHWHVQCLIVSSIRTVLFVWATSICMYACMYVCVYVQMKGKFGCMCVSLVRICNRLSFPGVIKECFFLRV